jgi:ATP-dependent helicase HrpB
MLRLPIDSVLPELTAALRGSRNLVLVAPPGAGKTTRVPPAILAAGLLSPEHPNLVMLQPRRVAARTVAERIADENGWELGRQVGYHVRFDRKLNDATRLRVLTEGILTRQLLDDPFLEGIGAVLLDEFHERSLFTDVAIALLREVQQTVRPDLILIVMSATLEAEPVAKYLGDCPIIRAQGRAFPVAVSYEPGNAPLPQRAAAAIERVVDDTDAGDVLAFLPGAEEIRRAQSALSHRDDLLVLPLYGSLSPAEQNLALRPAARQKVILATNIAETSLTIDGVRTVVDSGYARVASYDVDRGMDRLDLQRISMASATQRAGRAGRTAPGRCVRLWPAHEKLEPFDLPEIRRVDLAGTVLSLNAWGKPDVRAFGWYEAPAEETVAAAEELLEMIGALR